MAKDRQEKKLGLVAGYGDMPVEIIRSAKREGYAIVCIALRGMAHGNYASLTPYSLYVNLGEIDKTIGFLKSHQVSELFFAGKVDKTQLFSEDFQMDSKASVFMQQLGQGNDDAILTGLADLFESTGLKVLDSTRFLKTILPKKGVLSAHPISESLKQDIDFGYQTAKKIADLDIGQTVVVKSGVVLAVEAIEGTDDAILRGGELGREATVVVKVAKPKQDFRFDVPTIGKDTLKACIKAKVAALAFDSGSTIVLDLDEVLELATKHKIHLVSI
jgi:UDP-2,3-diacylglucosamine hydrolase